jgi:8-oxo-dGDP phosphatase
MKWRTGSRRQIYKSHWLELDLVEVTLPDGRNLQHEIVRAPWDGAATLVVVDNKVLMIHRHRFIGDTWGWELPGGAVEDGENPSVAAAREVLEETGWKPGPLRHLASHRPSSGWSDQRFHLYSADAAEHIGPPSEQNEASRVAWRSIAEVQADLMSGAVPDGLSQLGLAFALSAAQGVDLAGPEGWWHHGGPQSPDDLTEPGESSAPGPVP